MQYAGLKSLIGITLSTALLASFGANAQALVVTSPDFRIPVQLSPEAARYLKAHQARGAWIIHLPCTQHPI